MKKISGAAINALREALVHIYWYKEDLIRYLKHTLQDQKLVSRLDTNDTKRNIVTQLIDHMASHEDVFQDKILALMIETTKFDDFSHLRQLEDGEHKSERARETIGALKACVSGYKRLIDEKEVQEERRRIDYEKSLINRGTSEELEKLKNDYAGLFSLNAQARGFALEKLMKRMFELFDLDPKASFKIEGEQIDGAFTFEATDYIFECKWQQAPVDASLLDAFKGKLSRKLDNTLGLFLSINGYSSAAVDLHSSGRAMAILMDGQDLMAVFEGRISLIDLLSRKRKHAAQTGNIYFKVSDIL